MLSPQETPSESLGALETSEPQRILKSSLEWENALESQVNQRIKATAQGLAYSLALTMTLTGSIALLRTLPKAWFPILGASGLPLVVTVAGILQSESRKSSSDRVIQSLQHARNTQRAPQNPPEAPLRIPQAVSIPLESPEALESPLEPLPNPARDLGVNPQSALIAGVPGSGKTLFTLEALEHLTRNHPEVTVMMIDPKASEVETLNPPGVRMIRIPLSRPNGEAAGMFLDAIESFQTIQGPKLLVVDELASIVRCLKTARCHPKLIDFLTYITSMGDSEGAWCWLLTQDASCESLGMSQAMRANLRAIGLVSPRNLSALQSFLSGGWLPPHPKGSQEIYRLMDSSPTGRAIFDGKTALWSPLPKLLNRTGNDRDSRTFRTPSRATESPQDSPKDSPGISRETPQDSLGPNDLELLRWLMRRPSVSLSPRDIKKNSHPSVRALSTDQIRESLGRISRASIPDFELQESEGNWILWPRKSPMPQLS